MKERKITSLREISLDRRVNLPRTTLDHYNEMKLLMPPIQKLGKMYLYYEDELIKRINLIKKLKANKYTLKEIGEQIHKEILNEDNPPKN